jgi:thiol-disulfide isomerase/thioredoxin
MRRLAGLLPLLLAAAPADRDAHAPRLAVRTLAALPKPLPAPYDSRADAQRQVAAAAARAKASGKRLLIDFGANWCVDCRVLAGVLALPEMRPWVARHFELVQVDVGMFDRNLDIAARYGVQPLEAVPAVFVIDPRTGKLLNRQAILGLGDARLMQPQEMADWLAGWTR